MLGWRNCWRISASRSKPVADLAPLGKLAADDLDGGDAPGLFVRPPVDDPHGAGAQDRLDPERAQLFADQPLSLAHDREHPVAIQRGFAIRRARPLQDRGIEHDTPPAAGR